MCWPGPTVFTGMNSEWVRGSYTNWGTFNGPISSRSNLSGVVNTGAMLFETNDSERSPNWAVTDSRWMPTREAYQTSFSPNAAACRHAHPTEPVAGTMLSCTVYPVAGPIPWSRYARDDFNITNSLIHGTSAVSPLPSFSLTSMKPASSVPVQSRGLLSRDQ